MSLSFYFETRERKSCICIGTDFGASESTCWLHCVALMLRLLCGFSLLHPCYSGGRSVLLTTQKPHLTAGTQWRSTARLIAAPPGVWTVRHNDRGFVGTSVVYQQQQVAWIIPLQPCRIISCLGWLERRCRLDVAGEQSGSGASRPGHRLRDKTAWSRCVKSCWLYPLHMHKWEKATCMQVTCTDFGCPTSHSVYPTFR